MREHVWTYPWDQRQRERVLVILRPVDHMIGENAHRSPAVLGHDALEHSIVGVAKLHLLLHDQPGNCAGQGEGRGLGTPEHGPPIAGVGFGVGRGEQIHQKAGAARSQR